jgi:hypothetical protein
VNSRHDRLGQGDNLTLKGDQGPCAVLHAAGSSLLHVGSGAERRPIGGEHHGSHRIGDVNGLEVLAQARHQALDSAFRFAGELSEIRAIAPVISSRTSSSMPSFP